VPYKENTALIVIGLTSERSSGSEFRDYDVSTEVSHSSVRFCIGLQEAEIPHHFTFLKLLLSHKALDVGYQIRLFVGCSMLVNSDTLINLILGVCILLRV
jgi:hypothetical protein